MPKYFTEDLNSFFEELASFELRPLDFTRWAYPWDKGELEGLKGPLKWQEEVLDYRQQRLLDWDGQPIRCALSAAHGVGKSTENAFNNLHGFTTKANTRGYITANTENQLRTKTWPELAKWFRLMFFNELFVMEATAMYPANRSTAEEWRLDMIPFNEKKPEAFAGLHNYGKRLLMSMDEASIIPQVIWETSEGAETDLNTQIIRTAYGNPTEPNSTFRECFPGGMFDSEWKTWEISAWDVPITNKVKLASMKKSYGENSDNYRIRVLGKFPKSSTNSFIQREIADKAASRPVPKVNLAPVVMGVDVARGPTDYSILYPRQGLDAKSRLPRMFSELPFQDLLLEILKAVKEWDVKFCFIDWALTGSALLDVLYKTKVDCVFMPVRFGDKPDPYETEAEAGATYFNKRIQNWGRMKNWLLRGSIIESLEGYPTKLPQELAAPKLCFRDESETNMILEPKKDIREKLKHSPDLSDALSMTFDKDIDYNIELDTEEKIPYEPFSTKNIYEGMQNA